MTDQSKLTTPDYAHCPELLGTIPPTDAAVPADRGEVLSSATTQHDEDTDDDDDDGFNLICVLSDDEQILRVESVNVDRSGGSSNPLASTDDNIQTTTTTTRRMVGGGGDSNTTGSTTLSLRGGSSGQTSARYGGPVSSFSQLKDALQASSSRRLARSTNSDSGRGQGGVSRRMPPPPSQEKLTSPLGNYPPNDRFTINKNSAIVGGKRYSTATAASSNTWGTIAGDDDDEFNDVEAFDEQDFDHNGSDDWLQNLMSPSN